MKYIGKRLMALVLSFVMIIVFMPMDVLAESLSQEGYLEVKDGYLSVKVSTKNGGFLIDTIEGDKLNKSDNNKSLLYPDENYDTSFTSFRVSRGGEVKDYIFGRSYTFLDKILNMESGNVTVSKTDAGDGIVAEWGVDNLIFTQTLTLLGQTAKEHGMVYITYGVKSGDDRPVDKVEARILLDTALGDQDYASYELIEDSGAYRTIKEETVVGGSEYKDALFAYDNPKSPSITAYTVNASVDEKVIVPEKVAFGHWNNLAATRFDFSADRNMNFTSKYNRDYLTADSAYALYYDMGSVAARGKGNSIGTYYGVYSNVTVSSEDQVALNFIKTPSAMELNEKKNVYMSQLVEGEETGEIEITTLVKNVSNKNIGQLALAAYPQGGIVPYNLDGSLHDEEKEAYFQQVLDLKVGEERPVTIKFKVDPLGDTDYRKIDLRTFDVENTDLKLLSEKQLGSRSLYLLCPGIVGGAKLSFLSTSPETIHSQGSRKLSLTGKHFNLIRDSSAYKIKLKPISGGESIIVPSENFKLNASENIGTLVLDMELYPGTWEIVLDWDDDGKEDITSDALRFVVSENPKYKSVSYSVVTIEKETNMKYELKAYESLEEYDKIAQSKYNDILLEFRGDFNLTRDDKENLIKAEAVSLETINKKATNTITINNSLDIEKGTVTIGVDNFGKADQSINTDINGKVYTTGARTSVWDGVCALTSIKNGTPIELIEYDEIGNRKGDPDNPITLLWPGAASTAQGIAGLFMNFRYCEFGNITSKQGNEATKRQRVISFGAELSPNFLLPSNFNTKKQETSALEKVQLNLARSNYTASQLREVNERYETDQDNWEKSKVGTLELYVHDILFGGGFIGFNTSVAIGLPSYAKGLPAVEGSLDLKVMNKEWELGIKGSAELVMLNMEAELILRSYKGIPIPDKLYFFIGGFKPGINLDAHGIFWIRGAGGGVDEIYETLFPSDYIPPLTLLLSGEFSLFQVLSSRTDLALSMRGFSINMRNIDIAGIKILDRVGMEAYWYPSLRLGAGIELNILDAIIGEGSLLLEVRDYKDFFWEGYARVRLQIPGYIKLIGGKEIGSAEVGVNQDKVWGAARIIGIGVGVTYYWGGDVSVKLGKGGGYQASQSIFGEGIPVAYDDKSGQTLYMVIDNARLLGTNNDEPNILFDSPIQSDEGNLIHTLNLGKYGNEDGLLSIALPADSLLEAEGYIKDIKVSGYELKWLNEKIDADDPRNEDANATLTWDEESKMADISISFTDENVFNKNLTVNTPVAAELMLYGMERLADLESLTYDENTKKATINGDLGELSNLIISAVDADKNSWVVYQSEEITGTTEEIAVEFPQTMPSGDYILRAVGSTKDESSNPIVESGEFTHENSKQPVELNDVKAVLGGDYSIDLELDASTDNKYDGYLATIYEEKRDENDSLIWEATVLKNMEFPKDEDGLPSSLTVGGQHYTTEYWDRDDKDIKYDEEGNIIPPKKVSPDTEGAIEKPALVGLEAGKSYKVGVAGYKNLDDSGEDEIGGIIASKEKDSNTLKMEKPTETIVDFKVKDSVKIQSNYAIKDSEDEEAYTVPIDTVKNSDVIITVNESGGKLKSGSYSLDDGEYMDWNLNQEIELSGLSEGSHKLAFRGENETGDGVQAIYQFAVDTLPPRLMISSPNGGGFYEDQLSIIGISDKDARIYAEIEGEDVTSVEVGDDGTFTLNLTMNTGLAYTDIEIYAMDQVANQSKIALLQMTNKLLGDPNVELGLYLGSQEVTNGVLEEGVEGQLSLKFKVGEKTIDINPNSGAASRINWELQSIEGSASLNDQGYLISNKGDIGMVMGSIDQLQAAAVLNEQIQGEAPEDISPELVKYYKAINQVKEVDYTVESWLTYQLVVDENKVTGENIKGEIETATNNIIAAQGSLVFAGQAALDAVKLEASSKIELEYAKASWEIFVSERIIALALPETTNAEVLAKTAAINAAIAKLTGLSDLTEYNNALAKAGEDDYTAESWDIYQLVVRENIVTAENTKEEVEKAKNNILAAQGALVFAGKGDLDVAKSNANNKKAEDYSNVSWNDLLNALALPETTNTQVIAKTEAINIAVEKLVFAGQEVLDESILKIRSQKEEDYGTTKWTTFELERDSALDLQEDTNEQILIKIAAINAAIAKLTGLTDLTDYNNALGKVVEGDYTVKSWSVYQDLVTQNKVTEKNTVEEVALATSNILEAQKSLVFAGKAALEAAKKEASSKIESEYAKASWALFVVEWTKAQLLEETTNRKILVKTTAINAAIGKLTGLSDLTEYNQVIESVVEDNYTIKSWSAYQLVVDANIVTAENTEEEITAAILAIKTAQNDLITKADGNLAAEAAFYELVKDLYTIENIAKVKFDRKTDNIVIEFANIQSDKIYSDIEAFLKKILSEIKLKSIKFKDGGELILDPENLDIFGLASSILKKMGAEKDDFDKKSIKFIGTIDLDDYEEFTKEFTVTFYDKSKVNEDRDNSGGGGYSSNDIISIYKINIPKEIPNGKIIVSPASAKAGMMAVIDTIAKEGYKLSKISVTDSRGNIVKLIDQGQGKYSFIMPASQIKVDVSFEEIEKIEEIKEIEEEVKVVKFTDVKDGDYFKDAVDWAVKKGITSGTSDTSFSPHGVATRAQALTFLWRAMGSPEPLAKVNPFKDIKTDAYYYKAVLWAVENDITMGTSQGKFSPDDTVARNQIMVFQWRAAGKPVSKASNPFTDVKTTDYFADAVAWAVENSITKGTSKITFGPEDPCTRAQTVTLLYNYLGK